MPNSTQWESDECHSAGHFYICIDNESSDWSRKLITYCYGKPMSEFFSSSLNALLNLVHIHFPFVVDFVIWNFVFEGIEFIE